MTGSFCARPAFKITYVKMKRYFQSERIYLILYPLCIRTAGGV